MARSLRLASTRIAPSAGISSSTPEFLTVTEAAALLRVDRKTLYEAIERGKLPGVFRVGRCIRIRRDLLLACAGTEV